MKRRQFVATTGTAALFSTAGCISTFSSKTMSNPAEEHEEDGETHLKYRTDDQKLATVTIQPRRNSAISKARLPVKVSISHREGTKIQSLKLRLRAPPGGVGPPAEIAFVSPQWGPDISIQLYSENDGTILDISDTGIQGEGTMTLDFILNLLDESISELLVEPNIKLADKGILGGSYTLKGLTRVQLWNRENSS